MVATVLRFLDRFLVNVDWTERFGEYQEKVGNMAKSDHRMLWLEKEISKGGPRPFQFQLYWLEQKNIIQLMEQWWKDWQKKIVEK